MKTPAINNVWIFDLEVQNARVLVNGSMQINSIFSVLVRGPAMNKDENGGLIVHPCEEGLSKGVGYSR